MIFKPPCLKNKCIKLPVCRYKNEIVCDILVDYYTDTVISVFDGTQASSNNVKKEIVNFFPRIKKLSIDGSYPIFFR